MNTTILANVKQGVLNEITLTEKERDKFDGFRSQFLANDLIDNAKTMECLSSLAVLRIGRLNDILAELAL